MSEIQLKKSPYLQEHVREGKAALVHIRTEANLADIGTKPLTPRPFHHLASYIWSDH